MATIVERTRKNGSIVYLAQIVRRKHSHGESRSFRTRKLATAWADKREREIDNAIACGKPIALANPRSVPTLGDAIARYLRESEKAIGKTKAQCLRTIMAEYQIVEMRCDQITSQTLTDFAQQLRTRPAAPSTVLNYMSHLSSIFAIAEPAWGYPLDTKHMAAAMKVCKRLGVTDKADKRSRRPTLVELDRLLAHFRSLTACRPSSIPMPHITLFALLSTRRQGEITRLLWADYDREAKRILVRDMKHPGDEVGNDVWCDLPDPCCAIIDAMDVVSDRIFPVKADTISASFTRACHKLGIDDLHFHDLRHEGASRLAEMGYTVPQLEAVTGHRAWSSLQRYTHVRQHGDKYAGWTTLAPFRSACPEKSTKRKATKKRGTM